MKLPLLDDLHVHVRQDTMMQSIVPQVAIGGAGVALIMPNTVPPITHTEMAVRYRQQLVAIEPDVLYLMTLYLNQSLTPDEIRKAKAAGVVGVKSYPKGVTTNSSEGIEDYRLYYPIFETMQEEGLILNIHGEIPSNSITNTCVMNAERAFLKHLRQIHADFPRLKIVLEHATTRDAVETVKELGDTVGCTITVHHLELIVDDWAGSPIHFCKPVAKYPTDREALRDVVLAGHPKFFLGSDSAPHLVKAKTLLSNCSAGIFTSSHLLPYLAHIMHSFGALDKLPGFATELGRKFYGFDNFMRAAKAQWPQLSDQQLRDRLEKRPMVELIEQPCLVPNTITIKALKQDEIDDQVIPFMAGKQLSYSFRRL